MAKDSGKPVLVESRRIWDKAPHNAFTDLIRFKDRWYCVFREAEDHGSQDGVLRVITSPDGTEWESAALIRLTLQDLNDLHPVVPPEGAGMDLRDPKLCLTPDGRLMLNAGMYYNNRRELLSLVWYSDDGKIWGKPAKIGEHRYWLWRVTWHRGVAYSVGRIAAERIPRLYRAKDGSQFEVVVKDRDFFPHVPGASEATLRFLADDTALCLLRLNRVPGAKTVHGHLGIARPPYTDWAWNDLGAQIGGPNMIELPDGRFVAVVRMYDASVRTSLCWLDPDKGTMTEALRLPSGGDTSYAGLVWHDELLWISYYSSHEGKTSVYLAKVKIRPQLTWFREDFTETPPEIPVQQKHLANPDLILKRLGPGEGQIKRSFHENVPGDPHYVWSGLCPGNWAVAFEHRVSSVDLSGRGRVRWRTKQSADRVLRVIVNTGDGWLVSDRGTPQSEDWFIDEIDLTKCRWFRLDIESITKGAHVENPALSRVREIDFTDLMPGGQSKACSRLDWIEVYGKRNERKRAAQ